MDRFIDACLEWDESLFSYQRLPRFPAKNMHRIRLDCLSHALLKAIDDPNIDVQNEKLVDGSTIRDADVRKIAQVRHLIEIGCEPDSPALSLRIQINDAKMGSILKMASSMLQKNNNPEDSDDGRLLMSVCRTYGALRSSLLVL